MSLRQRVCTICKLSAFVEVLIVDVDMAAWEVALTVTAALAMISMAMLVFGDCEYDD